jgi:uncharacterized protein Yka (UPF0111/DUF47 family)
MGGSSALFGKMLNNVFPRVADFYGMLVEQASVLSEATVLLENLMGSNRPEIAIKIVELESQSAKLKDRNLQILAEAFATPMDREDIYRASASLDAATNYIKTTVREMELLGVTPDEHMRQMAVLIREGVDALKRGYAKLDGHPAAAEEDCKVVGQQERLVEKVYRKALGSLLDTEENMKGLKGSEPRDLMDQVMRTMKRREVYRHMSNAADQMANAGTVLHDIVVQIA